MKMNKGNMINFSFQYSRKMKFMNPTFDIFVFARYVFSEMHFVATLCIHF